LSLENISKRDFSLENISKRVWKYVKITLIFFL
jgi:hypothetical protein